MRKDFDVHYREWKQLDPTTGYESRELYGYILTEGGEFVIASSAYYQIRTAEKIAELVSLTAFSGMEKDRVKKTLADGAENLYSRTQELLWDPEQYKWLGAHTIEEMIYRLPRDTRELQIVVAKSAMDILTDYYERVGNTLAKKWLIQAAASHDKRWNNTRTSKENHIRYVSYTF